VRGYIVAGPGAYHRSVAITQYVGNGVICDPWYYICGTYPVSSVIGSRSEWDAGINVGGGIGIPIGQHSEFYIETRYHYVWGQTVPAPAAGQLPTSITVPTGSTSGAYWPLTFGIRF
jgi:hypothetical protein